MALLGIAIATWALCWFMQVQTFQDLYLTGGMAFKGPPIWRGIAMRSITAGDPIQAITNRHPATHSSSLGHFTVFCFHRSPWDISLISKDGALMYASADHYDQTKVYFDSMSAADTVALDREKLEYHMKMTTRPEESANTSDGIRQPADRSPKPSM